VLICLVVSAAILFGPMFLIVGSNLGGGILDLVLNRKPTVAELLGDYKLQVPWGNAKLQINADGTFQEQINENGKPVRNVSGRWQSAMVKTFLTLIFGPLEWFGMKITLAKLAVMESTSTNRILARPTALLTTILAKSLKGNK
jgi:predicted PurR-regulated permease PerM